jgi:hypothetical protein
VQEWVVTIMEFEGDKAVREWIGADKLGLFIQPGVLDDPWPGEARTSPSRGVPTRRLKSGVS